MALDTRWKNPQGKDLEALWRWAQDTTAELRKGAFFSTQVGSGITNAQLADMAAWTIKMRNAGTTGEAQDQTINDLTAQASIQTFADFVPLWDASLGEMRKALPTNFFQSGGLQLLASGTVTNAATLDISLVNVTVYRALKFVLTSFVPATDDVEFWMRFSTDGGANFDATGYVCSLFNVFGNGVTASNLGGVAVNQVNIARHTSLNVSVSNVAAEGGVDTEITLSGAPSTGRWSGVNYFGSYVATDGQFAGFRGSARRSAAQDTDAVRFLFETGNIASGNWALYGYA